MLLLQEQGKNSQKLSGENSASSEWLIKIIDQNFEVSLHNE
jgi:hypothetical protein